MARTSSIWRRSRHAPAAPAGASPVCSGTERLLYVDVDRGHAIEGFTISKVYYTVGVCECEAACDDLPDCVAFVDNKKPNSGAPACSLKSSSSTLHEASDVTAKDVYSSRITRRRR